jgi:hypothetical protein
MNVYVTNTPEISTSKTTKVVELLNSIKGPLNFFLVDKLSKANHRNLVDFDDNTLPIFFDNLNKVAESERDSFSYNHDDFYVILTSKKLDNAFYGKNWFSYFNQRNIFVRTYGWEIHTRRKTHIAIAHQVIENIFQSLSGYKFKDFTRYHDRPQGCLNDFCHNEYEIEFKLRTGHICKTCLDTAVDNGITIELVGQINRYLNFFRGELLDIQSTIDEMPVPKVMITEKGKVIVSNKEIGLKHINRALYIFAVLNRGEVLSLSYLKYRYDDFKNIYFAIKKTGNDKAVKTFMGIDVNPQGERVVVRELSKSNKYLTDVRNEIKTSFKEVLGDELAEILKIGLFNKPDYTKTSQSCFILPENPRLEFEIDQGFMEMIE